jgi:hypothetical protein
MYSDAHAGRAQDTPRRKRRRRGPLPALLAGKHAGTTPPTTSALIRTSAAAEPPLPESDQPWLGQRDPPGPLPLLVQFGDLKTANIVASYCGLELLIRRHGFPPGRWLGASTRVWLVDEVVQWLATRPTERPPFEHTKTRRRVP